MLCEIFLRNQEEEEKPISVSNFQKLVWDKRRGKGKPTIRCLLTLKIYSPFFLLSWFLSKNSAWLFASSIFAVFQFISNSRISGNKYGKKRKPDRFTGIYVRFPSDPKSCSNGMWCAIAGKSRWLPLKSHRKLISWLPNPEEEDEEPVYGNW